MTILKEHKDNTKHKTKAGATLTPPKTGLFGLFDNQQNADLMSYLYMWPAKNCEYNDNYHVNFLHNKSIALFFSIYKITVLSNICDLFFLSERKPKIMHLQWKICCVMNLSQVMTTKNILIHSGHWCKWWFSGSIPSSGYEVFLDPSS